MFRIILVFLSIGIAYLNFIVYKSYVLQTSVVVDFNTRDYKKENFVRLENSNINFPSLSGTAFPMYALLANYKIMFGDYDGALKLLNENKPINPYLRVRESLKAEVYFRLGIRDSSYYYSKIAHEELPKNARHFQQYITELAWRKDKDEMNRVFINSKAKSRPEFWKNYFAGIINLKGEDDFFVDSLAHIALDKFPTNKEIKAITGYILYGQENIKESYRLYEEALIQFQNSDFEKSSKNFIRASELNPLDYAFKENAGMSLIKQSKYYEAIKYLKESMASRDKPNDGKSEFGLGLCYKELNEQIKACEFFKLSMENNYKPAFEYFSLTCNK